ncbi:MAG: methyltransferase domain-containing protein [Deltaproteobacteria bacterium]|nr:methyltransferase domain-containing protein [Deltaproteobacteria bacterium]
MLQARRRFLGSGAYAPLAQALIAHLPEPSAGNRKEQVVVDVGCGEGYYSSAIDAHLQSTCVLGVDVSREAVRLAAKEHTRSMSEGPHFLVGDIKQGLPIKTEAVDVVVNVFAPRNPAEFARVLTAGGALLVAIPNAEHLQELRERFGGIGIEPDKEAHVIEQLAPSFSVEATAVWRQTLALPASAVRDLLHMTPSHHHVQADVDVEGLNVTASVRVLRFTRRPG